MKIPEWICSRLTEEQLVYLLEQQKKQNRKEIIDIMRRLSLIESKLLMLCCRTNETAE